MKKVMYQSSWKLTTVGVSLFGPGTSPPQAKQGADPWLSPVRATTGRQPLYNFFFRTQKIKMAIKLQFLFKFLIFLELKKNTICVLI